MSSLNDKDYNIDLERNERQGFHEVVYAEGKSNEQLRDICRVFISSGTPLLVTRIKETQFSIFNDLTDIGYTYLNRDGRTFIWSKKEIAADELKGRVNIISAGTSDTAILREVESTLTFFGYKSVAISDCGVAGVHRILKHKPLLDSADVNIVIAGMDGALPSVVGGLSGKPIIAVPTSVGYGASFNGVSALLAMLNSCSSGVSVVNIDNGFGAAMAAIRILKSIYNNR
jgi:pyridinium-3,5-biscarboxylic acid mononucleotide synthase